MTDIFSENKWHSLELKSVVVAPIMQKDKLIVTTKPPPHYQLAIKTSGHSTIVYNGKQLEFKTGSILFLPMVNSQPTVRYEKYIVEEGSSIVIFFMSGEELPEEAFAYDPDTPQVLCDLFRQLYNTWSGKSQTYYCDCMSLVYRIISQLQRRNLTGRDTAYYRNRLIKSVAFMHKHFREIKLDQHRLAEVSDMNYDYFRHVFKEAYGMSPVQYINRLKIENAKELIASRLYSVQEIAELTGFSNQYYFSRCFKTLTGVTPTQYRDEYYMI